MARLISHSFEIQRSLESLRDRNTAMPFISLRNRNVEVAAAHKCRDGRREREGSTGLPPTMISLTCAAWKMNRSCSLRSIIAQMINHRHARCVGFSLSQAIGNNN